ncbi:hypothetical protein ASD74_12070 [Rhizobium sp. Root564]|nr:hypothetical protein ASD74_12070 [Rhizobium sp. Root564]
MSFAKDDDTLVFDDERDARVSLKADNPQSVTNVISQRAAFGKHGQTTQEFTDAVKISVSNAG